MHNHLFLICPTDYLESVIANTFNQRNYYFTSLGNSIVFDTATVEQIIELIETKNINEISFVLSDDNSIILDALGKQNFSEITALTGFYDNIIKQKKHSEVSWQTCNRQALILSYYLNNKIKELGKILRGSCFEQLKIYGKIYNRQEMNFSDIYPDSVCRGYFDLN